MITRNFATSGKAKTSGFLKRATKQSWPILAACSSGFIFYASLKLWNRKDFHLSALDLSSYMKSDNKKEAVEDFEEEEFTSNKAVDCVVSISFSRSGIRSLIHSRMKGSGVVVSEDGFILTNAATIMKIKDNDTPQKLVEVCFADGTIIEGKVVHVDTERDLAAIKLTGIMEPLEFAELAGSYSINNGDDIIVLSGSNKALLISATETTGKVIEALHQGLETNEDKSMSETEPERTCNVMLLNANIKELNSGGPIVNKDGHILGIVSTVQLRTDSEETVVEAIPLDEVQQFLQEARNQYNKILEEKWKLRETTDHSDLRHRFGMKIATIRPGSVQRMREKGYDLPDVERGVLVACVEHQQLADRIGLRSGDIIVWMNEEVITNTKQVFWIAQENKKLYIKLIRNNEERTFIYK